MTVRNSAMKVIPLKRTIQTKTRLEEYVFLSSVISQIWKGAETVGVCNALAGATALAEDPQIQDGELAEELTYLWQFAYKTRK